jgi:hypothetical protein
MNDGLKRDRAAARKEGRADMAKDQDGRDQGGGIGRRSFFGASLGAAAGAVALTAGGARPAEAQQTGSERTRARYRVTEHVEAYYRTNRYYRREE